MPSRDWLSRSSVALAFAAACSAPSSTGNDLVELQPTFLGPKGLLESITEVRVSVYGGGAVCDPDTGIVTNVGTESPVPTVLSRTCPAGVRFCGQLQIQRTDDERVFHAIGRAPTANGGADLDVATACTRVKVDRDALALNLELRRFVPPATCGNNQIELTEQCEKPDALCDDACQTSEIVLSKGSNDPTTYKTSNTQDAKRTNDKERPSFVWPSSSDESVGKFFSVFTDRTDAAASVDLAGAIRGVDFGTTNVLGPFAEKYSFFLPKTASDPFPPPRAITDQANPVVAFADGGYYVAFDSTVASGNSDIRLRKYDTSLKLVLNVGINGSSPNGSGEPGIQTRPAMVAGADGVLFIAWYNQATKRYFGRSLKNPGTGALVYGDVQDIGAAASDTAQLSIAPLTNGFVIVWETATAIRFRVVGQNGQPLGTDTTVTRVSGSYHHPSVAALDRRFVVVWQDQDRKAINFQRYLNENSPVVGDQDLSLSGSGDPDEPVVAPTLGGGGSYVAAWVEKVSGHVMGRFLGSLDGFFTNSVNGQESEFQASVTAGHTRGAPALAVGGRGFVVFGWEDRSATPGIVGRRFPIANY